MKNGSTSVGKSLIRRAAASQPGAMPAAVNAGRVIVNGGWYYMSFLPPFLPVLEALPRTWQTLPANHLPTHVSRCPASGHRIARDRNFNMEGLMSFINAGGVLLLALIAGVLLDDAGISRWLAGLRDAAGF
jgi:hypothetical protein